MNPHHLALFRTVADHGSITRASEALHISQPAVSAQVAALERQVGAKLFDRQPRGVRLTAAGEVLVGYARRIDQLEQEAKRALEDHLNLRSGRLSVGASTSIGSYLLPEVMGRYARRHPGVQLDLTISNTESIQQRLEDGTFDLGLTEGLAPADTFEIEVFREDRLILIVPPGHPLVDQGRVHLRQVLDFPLLVRELGSGTRAVLEQAFAQRGFELRPAMSLGSSEALKRAVAAGLGLALVSELTVGPELELERLVVVPIQDLAIYRPLHLLRPLGREAPRTVHAFIELLGELG